MMTDKLSRFASKFSHPTADFAGTSPPTALTAAEKIARSRGSTSARTEHVGSTIAEHGRFGS